MECYTTRFVVAAAPQVSRKEQCATRRVEFGNEYIAPTGVVRLASVRGREIQGLRVAGHVNLARIADGDVISNIVRAASQVGSVIQYRVYHQRICPVEIT